MLELSETMEEVLGVIREHNGRLVRWEHGFWTYEGCISEYEHNISKRNDYYKANTYWLEHDKVTPTWSCKVQTLRALQSRGYVKLSETMCIIA